VVLAELFSKVNAQSDDGYSKRGHFNPTDIELVRCFSPCEPFIIQGRPSVDQAGYFELTKAPGFEPARVLK
jgi:hypothetical protein